VKQSEKLCVISFWLPLFVSWHCSTWDGTKGVHSLDSTIRDTEVLDSVLSQWRCDDWCVALLGCRSIFGTSRSTMACHLTNRLERSDTMVKSSRWSIFIFTQQRHPLTWVGRYCNATIVYPYAQSLLENLSPEDVALHFNGTVRVTRTDDSSSDDLTRTWVEECNLRRLSGGH